MPASRSAATAPARSRDESDARSWPPLPSVALTALASTILWSIIVGAAVRLLG